MQHLPDFYLLHDLACFEDRIKAPGLQCEKISRIQDMETLQLRSASAQSGALC